MYVVSLSAVVFLWGIHTEPGGRKVEVGVPGIVMEVRELCF